MGKEFSAKDFRTWGGTLLAAVALAECGPVESEAEAKRTVTEQYLGGRALEDFRPRHLPVVGARDVALETEEQALSSVLRSWRLRQARREAGKAA
jgi:DNA topoisomerase IB